MGCVLKFKPCIMAVKSRSNYYFTTDEYFMLN